MRIYERADLGTQKDAPARNRAVLEQCESINLAECVARQLFGSFSVGKRPTLLVAQSGWELRREIFTRQQAGWIFLAAPQSPWQNAYLERLIGSIRPEMLGSRCVAEAHGKGVHHELIQRVDKLRDR
jgi:hypothetical protein